MTRRFFGIGLAALLVGCSGAGVSSSDLRSKVAAEVAQIVVNREQLEPWISNTSITFAQLNSAITTVRSRVSARHAVEFTVPELHDLRRFYSSRDGQSVLALAYASEGNRDRPVLDPAQVSRVEMALTDPVIARSLSAVRAILREAFKTEFAFR